MKKTALVSLVLILSSLLGGSKNDPPTKETKDLFFKSFHESCQIIYVKEAVGEDHWQTPSETDTLNTGDCEDKLFFLKYSLKKDGIETNFMAGFLDVEKTLKNPDNPQGHSWLNYEFKGDTYVVDPTRGVIRNRRFIPVEEYFEFLQKEKLELKYQEYFSRLNDEEKKLLGDKLFEDKPLKHKIWEYKIQEDNLQKYGPLKN